MEEVLMSYSRFALLSLLSLPLFGGCERVEPSPPVASPSAPEPVAESSLDPRIEESEPLSPHSATSIETKGRRVIAVGDLHGDLGATRRVLELAGLLGEDGAWTGGDTILVQTGDVLDRGDDEKEIFELLWTLRDQARESGGEVVLLLGNHETMNARGDLRYVTPGGFEDFEGIRPSAQLAKKLEDADPSTLGRLAAFSPTGIWATKLATHKVIGIVGDSMFVHGGVAPAHVAYGIDKLNEEVASWFRGESEWPALMEGPTSPLWMRDYSSDTTMEGCQMLEETLEMAGVTRMIVGHTPQPHGVTSACDKKVWRIDVGMASHYGGQPSALQILEDGSVTPLIHTEVEAPQK